jgi:hypothetical protein
MKYESLEDYKRCLALTALERPFGCKCQTMAIKLVGDGCSECNPDYWADMMEDDGE